MEKIFKEFLWTKGVLVTSVIGQLRNPVARDELESRFGIRLTQDSQEFHPKMIPFLEEQLGMGTPSGFYQYFPASVKEMPPALLQYEQACHYLEEDAEENTLPDHSMLEGVHTRQAFSEVTAPKYFTIISEKDVKDKLFSIIDDMLLSPKPLTQMQYKVLLSSIRIYHYDVQICRCNHTAKRLVLDTGDIRYAEFLGVSDVLDIAQTLSDRRDTYPRTKHIKLSAKDRKFVTELMDHILAKGVCDMEKCFEKQAKWCGLLHHLHYQSTELVGIMFLQAMRGQENYSTYAAVEHALASGDAISAVNAMYEGKGSDGVLRHLVYLVSHCRLEKEVAEVLKYIKNGTPYQLIKTYQALMQFDISSPDTPRTLQYTKQGQTVCHTAKPFAPTYPITQKRLDKMHQAVQQTLLRTLKGRVGRVYISPEMYRTALPLWNDAISGYGVLPKGSRIIIPQTQKLRFFTSWQGQGKYDVDLSLIGVTEDGERVELSWRTMHNHQSKAIAHSGDALSSSQGSAEYLDVDISALAEVYPHIKYFVVCQNMYTGQHFSQCPTYSGYMLRDREDTGDTYEVKTVQARFEVACQSSFVQLFMINVAERSLVWLCAPQAFDAKLAIKANHMNLPKVTPCVSLGWLFEQMATEVVSAPYLAEVVVGACQESVPANTHPLQIKACDTERMLALLAEE